MAEVANAVIVSLLILGALLLTFTRAEAIEFSSISDDEGLSSSGQTSNSFVLDMMHIHHQDLSYLPANVTLSERIEHSVKNDEERLKYLANQVRRKNASFGTEDTFASQVYSAKGIYITQIYIGTPPRPQRVVLDTASSLVWVQCEPCENTLKQREEVFDPRPPKSSSYKAMPFTDPYCTELTPDITATKSADNTCMYSLKFAGTVSSEGDFAYETMTFLTPGDKPTPEKIERFPFGCAHKVVGALNHAAGTLGLGRLSYSLISQLRKSFRMSIFSYCLVKYGSLRTKTTPLPLGPAPIKVPNVKYTPIIHHPDSRNLYYLIMTGISVDGTKLSYRDGIFYLNGDEGGVMIDPGLTASAFKTEIYMPFRDAVMHSMRTLGYPVVHNPSRYPFSPCYSVLAMDIVNQIPKVTFHFQNLDFELPFMNLFLEVSAALYCFAVYHTAPPMLSIIGGVQQQNTDIYYDVRLNRLGIAPKIC